MKVKLIFDAQFIGKIEKVITVDSFTEKDCNKLFFKYIGVVYDENCSYEILE
jgi:hypothetical protein